MTGQLIVLEGTDGTGKDTQTALLLKRLQSAGRRVATYHFPRYGEPSAYFVERYLRGGYPTKLDAYEASILYALDRHEASFEIRDQLAVGTIVVANRYTSSSMAHLGGTIRDQVERWKFLDWLSELEYGRLKIPEPTKILVLHMPAEQAQKHVEARKPQPHLGGLKRDIHEEDLDHLMNAEAVYLELCQMKPDLYELIECAEGSTIKSIPEIHELIWAQMEALLASPAS
jgi:thymidylate kinase